MPTTGGRRTRPYGVVLQVGSMDIIMTMASTILDHCYGAVRNPSDFIHHIRIEEECGQQSFVIADCNGNTKVEAGAMDKLPEKILSGILSYLNPTDLRLCRLVSKPWNMAVTSTQNFTDSFILKVTNDPRAIANFSDSSICWPNVALSVTEARIRLLPTRMLQPIKFIQLESIALSWTTLANLLSLLPTLHHLSVTHCTLPPSDSNQNLDFQTFTSLKRLTLQTKGLLSTINGILTLVNSQETALEEFYLSFYESSNILCLDECELLNAELFDLINRNEDTLRCLHVNLRSKDLVTGFCTQVLESYRGSMRNLEEFQLSPYMPEDENPLWVEASPFTLVRFLQRHSQLKVVGFPHFTECSNDAKRRKILKSLPPTVRSLSLPGHSYLVPEFFTLLPELTRIQLGSSSSKAFHPNAFRYAPSVCGKVREISIFTKIHMSPGKLGNFAWKFPTLTKFEFDVFRPLLNDLDLQTIILNCRWLRHLSISECDLITDFGLTGAPLEWCREILRLGIIYMDTPLRVPRKGKFQPIATIKGLVTLKLSGSSSVTDVGLFYGVRFLELKHLRLPAADQVTGWGLRQVGRWNPSLESFGASGMNIANFKILEELGCTHARLSLDQIYVERWFKNPQHRLSSPSMLTAVVGQT